MSFLTKLSASAVCGVLALALVGCGGSDNKGGALGDAVPTHTGPIFSDAAFPALPRSIAPNEPLPENAVRITVNQEDVLFNGDAVTTLAEVRAFKVSTHTPVIAGLGDKLIAAAEAEAAAVANGALDNAERGKVIIFVDKNLEYDIIFKIMQTCMSIDFRNVYLAVTSSVSTELSAIYAKLPEPLRIAPGERKLGIVSGQIKGRAVTSPDNSGSAPDNFASDVDAIISGTGGLKGGGVNNMREAQKIGGLGGTMTSGGRTRASIQRVVMQNMPTLRRDYNERLREKSDLSGTITVKFAINEHGEIIFAQTVESTMNDPKFEKTVVERVRAFRFEAIDKPGDVTEIVYPFVFAQ